MAEFNDRRLVSMSRSKAKAAGHCGAGYQTTMGSVFTCLRAPGHPSRTEDGVGHSAERQHTAMAMPKTRDELHDHIHGPAHPEVVEASDYSRNYLKMLHDSLHDHPNAPHQH